MSDMIERMAAAMRASKAWPAVFDAGTAEVLAAAVLDAIEEPTPEMLRAGIDNCALSIRQDRAGARQMTTPFEDECGQIFRAMIQAAKGRA